jgi:hypothetical protein
MEKSKKPSTPVYYEFTSYNPWKVRVIKRSITQNSPIFWDRTPCSQVKSTDVSEEYIAFIPESKSESLKKPKRNRYQA